MSTKIFNEPKLRVGIKFGDNDFYNTFKPFFELIIANLDFTPTKEQVVELFNANSYGLYLAFQNRFGYDYKGTDGYLKITAERVYINEELDAFFVANDWDNGEFFYWDGYGFGTL